MKFSVVTISFNQAQFLSRCIESILSQGYDNYEYVIVDPGSTDGSRDIIESYSAKLSKIIFEPDNGPADGLNKGFKNASGEVLFYLNADDEIEPGAFAEVAQKFLQEPSIDVLLGHGYQIDEKGLVVRKIYSTNWSARRYSYGLANAIQQSTFFRRNTYQEAGGFNVANHTCWDGELLIDMALNGASFSLINRYFGRFRIYPDSITGSGRLRTQYRSDQQRIATKILGRSPDWRESTLNVLGRILRIIGKPQRSREKIKTLRARAPASQA